MSYIHCVSKRVPTFKLFVTLSNLNRFLKFLHCWKAHEIWYTMLIWFLLNILWKSILFYAKRTSVNNTLHTGHETLYGQATPLPARSVTTEQPRPHSGLLQDVGWQYSWQVARSSLITYMEQKIINTWASGVKKGIHTARGYARSRAALHRDALIAHVQINDSIHTERVG